ncbi:hypothetical protein JCM17960_00450 [Magnetospira thiophila]
MRISKLSVSRGMTRMAAFLGLLLLLGLSVSSAQSADLLDKLGRWAIGQSGGDPNSSEADNALSTTREILHNDANWSENFKQRYEEGNSKPGKASSGTSSGADTPPRSNQVQAAALQAETAAPVVTPQGSKTTIAVIIGNRDYKAPIPDVLYAENDAAAFGWYALNVLGVEPANLIDLRNATLGDLTAVFGGHENGKGRIFDLVSGNQTDVVVFYSGHGVPGLKDKRGYLLPVDGDPNRAELTGYSLDMMMSNLQSLKAKSVKVFIDACFSGTSFAGQMVTGVSGLTVEPHLPASGNRVHVLTAAQADEVASWDAKAEHGLFTEYLLRGLHGEAAKGTYGNGTGRITLAGLKAYLDDQMTFAARRDYGRDQHSSLDGNGQIVVADVNLQALPARPKIVTGKAIAPDKPTLAAVPQVPDDVLMRNGDRFKAKLLQDAVSILTPYGRLAVPRSAIAELHLTGDNKNVETILTVYGGRFSGQLLDDKIEVEVAGNPLPLRKEKVASIKLAPAGKPADPKTSVQVMMRNTDAFSVDLVTTEFKVRTSYGELAFPKDKIKEIAFEGNQRVIGKITLKENQGVFQGDLLNEDIEIRTAFGAGLLVYKDKLAMVDLMPEKLGETVGVVAQATFPPKTATASKQSGQSFQDCPQCPVMVVIPSGSFRMGDLSGGGGSDEKPVHRVSIDYAFAVGKYEVTQQEWEFIMGGNPSRFSGIDRPVEQVSWDDAQEFIRKLIKKTGKKYRLLSEAEWEYVARAGTDTKWSCGNSDLCLNDVAWFDKNSGSQTHSVGGKQPNPFGVHDMHGNVWEWVQDCYQDRYANTPTDGSAREGNNSCHRVVRGGSWSNVPRDLRSAYRDWGPPDGRDSYLGFRLARTL